MIKGRFIRVASREATGTDFSLIQYEQKCTLNINDDYVKTASDKRSTSRELMSRSWTIDFSMIMTISQFVSFVNNILSRKMCVWAILYDMETIEGLGFVTRLTAVANAKGYVTMRGNIQGTGELTHSSNVYVYNFLLDSDDFFLQDSNDNYLIVQ